MQRAAEWGWSAELPVGAHGTAERLLDDARCAGVGQLRLHLSLGALGAEEWARWLVRRFHRAGVELLACVRVPVDPRPLPPSLAALPWESVELRLEPTQVEPDPFTTVRALSPWGRALRARGKQVALGGLDARRPTRALDLLAAGAEVDALALDATGAPWSAGLAELHDGLRARGLSLPLWLCCEGPGGGSIPELLEAREAPAARVFWQDWSALRTEAGAGLLLRLSRELGPERLRPGWAELTGPVRQRPVTAVVFGGAGFIGSNVAHRLLSDGHRVRVFDNLSRPLVERNLRWLREQHPDRLEVAVGDVRDPQAVRAAMDGAEQVFHFAAQVAVTTSLERPVTDFDINARGTLNVLEAARQQSRPPSLLFTSTNKVYGGLEDLALEVRGQRYEPRDAALRAHGVSEERPLDFESPYGCSKGAADLYVLDYARTFGLPAAVFRMSCIYGPRQFGTEDQGWVAHFLIRALQGQSITLYGDGMQVRDLLYIDDLVEAMVLAQRQMTRVQGQAFNVGGGPTRTVSLLELVSAIEQLRGERLSLQHEEWRPGDQRYYVSDTRKLQRQLGWAPQVGVREGVAALNAWLESLRTGVLPSTPRARQSPVEVRVG